MPGMQKPKLLRLGEEGSSQDIKGHFLQLLNEHDSRADFEIEQQLAAQQFGMATPLSLEPEDSRNNNEHIDHIIDIKEEIKQE
jgi:hypothetical protein